MIVGGRGSADSIRYGCEKAEMEALFSLPSGHPVWETLERLGIEAQREEHLIIRRELTSQGKSTSRVNGQMVNLTMLREIGEQLVNIHGQHEHQNLLKAERHLGLLDTYGEPIIGPLKAIFQERYSAFAKVEKSCESCRNPARRHTKCLTYIVFSLKKFHPPD